MNNDYKTNTYISQYFEQAFIDATPLGHYKCSRFSEKSMSFINTNKMRGPIYNLLQDTLINAENAKYQLKCPPI